MKRRRSDFQYCEYFVRLILSLYFRSDITRAGKKLTDGTGRLIFDILVYKPEPSIQYSLGKRPAERACEFDGSNADATRKVVGRPSTYRKKQHLRSHLRSYAATYGTPDI